MFDRLGTFGKQFANNSSIQFLYQIGAFIPRGVADDPTTKTYLATGSTFAGNSGIYRFFEDAAGAFPYMGNHAEVKPPPISIVTSAANCNQLALGYLRNIYAVCGSAIEVFTPTASGNAAPLRALSGSRTELNSPMGIYEGK